jgi:DNA repair protein RecO (recombination protein O)
MSGADARVDRQPAFVLHRRNYRETSLLLDLLTRDFGRVGAVARGVRGARRGPGASCQPFQPLVVSWSGRGELKTLSAAESAAAAPAIAGERLFSALYVNEVLVRTLPQHDAHGVLFDAYAGLLPALAAGEDIEARLRGFELLLLRELGYGLEFDRDAVSGALLDPAGNYAFTPCAGFSALREEPGPGGYPGWVLAEIGRADFSRPQTRRYAKRLMREALAELLGDRPLRSRAYFLARPAPRDGGEAV